MLTFNINCHVIYKNVIPKIANLLGDTSDQPSKFRTRNWIEINSKTIQKVHILMQTLNVRLQR